MSNRTTANDYVRRRYAQGSEIIPRTEGRKLTQREFLDVGFGNNPRTGKPYNTRTLRKWLSGERDASKAVQHSLQNTYSFQQRVNIQGQDYGPLLTKPTGASGLDLFTPSGRKRVRRAARERLNARIEERRRYPSVDTHIKTREQPYRPVKTTRGMQMRSAHAVSRTRRPSVIIRRDRRKSIRYAA